MWDPPFNQDSPDFSWPCCNCVKCSVEAVLPPGERRSGFALLGVLRSLLRIPTEPLAQLGRQDGAAGLLMEGKIQLYCPKREIQVVKMHNIDRYRPDLKQTNKYPTPP